MINLNLDSMNYDEKFALLFGILLGDGCLSFYRSGGRNYYAICISGDYYTDKPFYESIVCPLVDSLRENKLRIKFKENVNQGKIEVLFTDKELFHKLNSLGFPIGKKGTELHIQDYFYKNNLINYVIAGYLATDGCLVLTKNPNKFYPRIEGTGISPKLLNQITDYLNSIEMNGSFYEAKRKDAYQFGSLRQKIYRFQFNGKRNLLLFEELVGFVNPKHNERFRNFLKYNEEYDRNIKGIPTQKQYSVRELVILEK